MKSIRYCIARLKCLIGQHVKYSMKEKEGSILKGWTGFVTPPGSYRMEIFIPSCICHPKPRGFVEVETFGEIWICACGKFLHNYPKVVVKDL